MGIQIWLSTGQCKSAQESAEHCRTVQNTLGQRRTVQDNAGLRVTVQDRDSAKQFMTVQGDSAG